MALDISLAQFDAIASGDFNAGQIDYNGSGSDVSLKKVNAHVHFRSLNTATIEAKRVVELKQAFVRAMESKLGNDNGAIAEIRKSLGLPPDNTMPRALSSRMIEPLTRQEVRELIDKYVKRPDGSNAQAVNQDVVDKRNTVNVANQRALPIQIGEQSFRIDKMAAELEKASVAEPTKSQAAEILKVLTRPNGKVDVPMLVRSLNIFAFMAEKTAAADLTEGAKDAGERFSAAFAQALDSLDNGALSQVYQGLVSRDADALKNELSRRLAKFDLTAGQADVCERTALAMGRLEALVLSEIGHRVALGKATTEAEAQEIAKQAPVLKHCGESVQRNLSARNTAGELTSVNLEILTSRAAYGNINERNLAGKTTENLVKLGFTKADAHDIGNMIRKSELTVNAFLSNLLGWRPGQDPKNPPLFQLGYSLVNTFVSKEQKGMAKDANGYLVRRNQVEKHFFPEYDKVPEFKGKDRPMYAAFNTAKLEGGAAQSYGGVVFVMKEHVKQQATYTLSDTFFALNYDFSGNSKEKFLASAEKYLSKLVKPEALATLADKTSVVGKALDRLFQLHASMGICSGQGFDTDSKVTDVADFLSRNRIDGAREIDKDDVMAILFDAIGVKDEELSRVAGYDNIENLLVGLKDADPLAFGLATSRRAQNPDAPIRLIGGEYIEAQLHGPIVISRDVSEMRILSDDISEHYFRIAEETPEITGGMDKNEWIAQQTEADKARLLKFGEDNGIKVVFYGEEYDKNKSISQTNLENDLIEIKRLMQNELTQYYNELVNGQDDLITTTGQGVVSDADGSVREVFGEKFDKVPQWLVDAAKAAAIQKASERVNNLTEFYGYSKQDVREIVSSTIQDIIGGVVDSVSVGHELGVTDNAKLLEFARQGQEMGATGPQNKAFVMAKVLEERIFADPPALIKETLEKELAGRKDEIASLGIPGGFELGGAAIKRLLAKVQEHLEKFAARKGATYLRDCTNLLSDIREKIVAPEINARLDLLKALDGKPFVNDAVKNSYFGWVMNAKRIKSAEELTGVKNSAEGLYTAFSTVLSADKDFGVPTYMAVLQDIALRIVAAAGADAQANYQGEFDAFGMDDRNGYISRAVSVGLAAIESSMGRAALERLGRIFASPGFVALYSAMSSAVGLQITTNANFGLVELCNSIHWGLLDRLTNKYGIATTPIEAYRVDYSQVAPNMREMLSLVSPELVDALNDKIPYAPQVVFTMPPVGNVAAAPQNLAARKRALMGALPAYGAHEKTFEHGRNIHGRGHATRVFIFANVLGNIMRERGVKVDLGALSITAAGHDMGRKGGGTDYWEKESGAMVAQLATNTYPGAYGDEWLMQANLNVSAGHGAEADAQRSVEGLLMKAADSLDYTRVAPLEAKRFHFLEKTMNVDGVHVMRDEGLRNALMHEAELLTKATSPLAEKREEITRLKLSNDEDERFQGEALEEEVTNDEIALAQLTDEQVVERIEKEIRDNPDKYPMLTKYYLNAE
jgi:hypothetical protein